MREASGNVTDLLSYVASHNITGPISYNVSEIVFDTSLVDNATEIPSPVERSWSIYGTDFNCTGGCKYGSHNSFQVR